MTPPADVQESEKQRLTEFLRREVAERLSGRDGVDLVEVVPSRALFAGVLKPALPRTQADLGDGSALGLDFRVRLLAPEGHLRVLVNAQCAVYYPAYPTFQQARNANSGSASEGDAPEPTAEATPTSDTDEASTETAGQPAASNAVGVETYLPPVFRRAVIPPSTIVFDIPRDTSTRRDILIEDGFRAALASATSDPRLWRYIGKPESTQRTVPGRTALSSPDCYASKLRELAGGQPVVLPQWAASVEIDVTPDAMDRSLHRVRILFVNRTPDADDTVPDRRLDERSLFDASLTVTLEGAELVPFSFTLAPRDYRHNPEMPVKGINCVGIRDSAQAVHSETLPVYGQPLYRTRDVLKIPFSDLASDRWAEALGQLGTEMKAYLNTWDAVLARPTPQWSPQEIAACREDRDSYASELDQYFLGLECLRSDSRLRLAFQLMNTCFSNLASKPGARTTAWRMFQIGFIVCQLPALAVRETVDDGPLSQRLRSSFEEVGVLWAPTGAGKTEAYLGLLAVALLYDRLRGKDRGVCAWMRFPLRMLSLQQLERLARVIAALNELRETDRRVAGGDPFSIGYFIGDGVTPNSISAEAMRAYQSPQGEARREAVRLLRKCPFCGGRVSIQALPNVWRLAHVCSSPECFSNTSKTLKQFRGSIPIVVVDTEIYRYLPSVLVGTVDKLAIVGRQRYFAHLMRGARQECPDHGLTSYGSCIERYNADCPRKPKEYCKVPVYRDPGPALLIQDELHLLRAELGVFNAHYEGLLKHIGRDVFMPPKVLAATATIEAYDRHAFHLYLSRARRFPCPSWQAGESFYATSTPRLERRTYVGVLVHTRSIEDAALRILGLYISAVRRLKQTPRRVAEIIGRPDLSDDDIQALLRVYDLCVAYVGKKATAGSIVDRSGHMERYFGDTRFGELTALSLTGDNTVDDIGSAIERIEREASDTGEKRLDVVAATSLISHGIDLERINMMLVCGMPSQYAEYVQSSSRAARTHPGLVFSCFRSREPREHSQFEFFMPMHEHMDRLIEPVAVNRFASYAPDKTVPGLLLGILLCEVTPKYFGNGVGTPLDDLKHLRAALGLTPAVGGTSAVISEQGLLETVTEIIGAERVRPPATSAQIANTRDRIADVVSRLLGDAGRSILSKAQEEWKPLTSFRDVDEGVEFGSVHSAGVVNRVRAK